MCVGRGGGCSLSVGQWGVGGAVHCRSGGGGGCSLSVCPGGGGGGGGC